MAESTKPPTKPPGKAPARKAAAAKKTTAAKKATRRVKEQTGGNEEMPLGGTAQRLAAWAIVAAGVAVAAKVSGRELPERVGIPDVLLIGIATHKLTRIVTKDWVTSPLRAPITKHEESKGSGEVEERSRGRGLQRAMGDLVTCPYCGSALIAGALVTGLVFAPRATRLVAALFASVAVSDWLHQGYDLTRSTRDSV